MEIDVLTTSMKPSHLEHPSKIQRQKLAEAKKKRLAEALRENLRKRKEQTRSRKLPD
jgi:hypothetical protein